VATEKLEGKSSELGEEAGHSPPPHTGFWGGAWHEIRPSARHTITTLFLLTFVTIVAFASEFLSCRFPHLTPLCDFLDVVDSYCGILVLCYFAANMFLDLTTMTLHALWRGWPGGLVRWLRGTFFKHSRR
jgi:hypothetical protein